MGETRPMAFEEAHAIFQRKMGHSRIMSLATSSENKPSVRTVSCLYYDEKIYFKTDINFRKTAQLLANPYVALCSDGVQCEGTLINKGLVVDEPGRKFEKLYEQYLAGSYNAYSHEDTEILLEITPNWVQMWDVDENNYGYQIFIDYQQKTAQYKQYD